MLARTEHKAHSAPQLALYDGIPIEVKGVQIWPCGFENCQNSKLMNLQVHAYILGTECIVEEPKRKIWV